MAQPSGPNPLTAALSMIRARRVRPPARSPVPGSAPVDHSPLGEVLGELQAEGVAALGGLRPQLARYREQLAAAAPENLTRDEALAFWLNLYNAGALDLAADSLIRGQGTVLRIGGGFRRTWAYISGEALSLDDVEHGKIRRFGDPRIHGSLVCGSASCPTLRYEPFRGDTIDEQLEDQMRTFLAQGGALRRNGVLLLSRIFLWYGADFTRPNRMPTLLPARKAAIADSLGRWLQPDLEEWRITTGPKVEFQKYDWSLACTIG